MESELTKKAYWQSRRGLQELDLILIPFVEDCFADLNQEDKITFLDLLNNEDIDLIDWLINKKNPPEKFLKIIDLVIKK